jgi:hypothetical protein
MVGEVRDEETARMAIQSSLTGHLVFSTLHTNDSAGAISRLLDLDVEPYLVSSSLIAVLAQRLVRKVCESCKVSYNATKSEFAKFGPEVAKYFLEKMRHIQNIKNVLLITCHNGVNYTRELFWIGMKRHIQSLKGVAVEYPKIDFLYNTYSENKKDLYGYGFNYAKKLTDDYTFSNDEIIEKIKNHFWDVVIYGKIGPDELLEGSMPHLPLWDHVSCHYTKDQIVFLYGGDECIDLTYDNRYSRHILYHGQFGHCFVRELNI